VFPRLRPFILNLSFQLSLRQLFLHCFPFPGQLQKTMPFAAINSAGKPITSIEEAFATEPSLKKRVYDAIGVYPTGGICSYAFPSDPDLLNTH
jgi:hypothetical protein